jgi:hypothetical protein
MTSPPNPNFHGEKTINRNLWRHLSLAVFNIMGGTPAYTYVRMPTRQTTSRLDRSITNKLREYDFDVYARCNNLVKEDWELLSVDIEYKLCNE